MQDKLALFNIATWAQSIALDLETRSGNGRNSSDSSDNLTTTPHVQESLSEKLLRWVAASVVLGEVAKEGNDAESKEQIFKTLSVIRCLNGSMLSDRDIASRILDEKLASLLFELEGHVNGKTENTSLVLVGVALVILSRLTRSSIHRGN